MKKAVFLLVIVIFIASAVLGFQAAARLSSGQSSQTQLNQSLPVPSTQTNYLLVHVNDLSVDNPQLVSVWGLFVFYSNPPQVMLIPLFPTYDETRSTALGSAFKISKDGQVSSRFIDEIEKVYEISTVGYVIVDNKGLSSFNKWITGDEIQISAVTPQTADEKHIVLYNSQQFFSTACAQFSRSGVTRFIDQIRWTDLLPSHFSTNLSFESLALAADYFTAAGEIDQCTVLSNE